MNQDRTLSIVNHLITLEPTVPSDLHTLFRFQQDPEGIYMAAFTPKDPHNKAAYMERFTGFLADPTIHTRTIRLNGVIVGSIAKFIMHHEAELTYWIDRQFWGQGIATTALKTFLELESARPLHGRVAFDNYASQRVLEKCGFVKIGKDKGFANARQAETEEYIYRLPE